MSDSAPAMADSSVTATTRNGMGLALMRAAWAGLCATALLLFVALAPSNVRDAAQNWQVVQSYSALAPWVSLPAYAAYYVVLHYAAALVFFAVAAVIVWHNSHEAITLLASLTLIGLPLVFNLGGYTDTWTDYPAAWQPALRAAREILGFGVVPTCWLALVFLFPNGRLAIARPRWLSG